MMTNIYIYIYIYTYIIYCILYHSIISWSCFLQSCPSNMFRKGYPQELVPPPSQGANGKSGPSIQAKTCWQYPMKVLKYSKICFDCQPQRISCSKRKNNNFRFAKWWFSLFLHRSSILRLELRDDVQADALSSSNTSHPVRQITRLGVLDPVFTGAYKFLRKKTENPRWSMIETWELESMLMVFPWKFSGISIASLLSWVPARFSKKNI